MATKKKVTKNKSVKKKSTTKASAPKSPVKTESKAKKLSLVDAALQVLTKSKEPLNAKQMVEKIAAAGLWASPSGKTPHATLYSSIIREIATKGSEARFVKVERGLFTANV